MPPISTLLFIVFTPYYLCTDGAARRVPISSFTRTSIGEISTADVEELEKSYNSSLVLSEKIKKALEPHTKNKVVTLLGPKSLPDPLKLQTEEMKFFSQYDSYESINFTDTELHGLANFTFTVNHVGVPRDDVAQVHMHLFVNLGRLDVAGNFAMKPASSEKVKSGRFNFTADEVLAVGGLMFSSDEAGSYRRLLMSYLPIQHDDMHIHLENASIDSEFLKHEVFESVDSQVREQIKRLLGCFADAVWEKVRALESNGQDSDSPPGPTGPEDPAGCGATEPPAAVPDGSELDSAFSQSSSSPQSSPSLVSNVGTVSEPLASVPKSSYAPTAPEELDVNATEALCRKVKKALLPYTGEDGVANIPGPSFFRDPISMNDVEYESHYVYDAVNFTGVSARGMGNYTVTIKWVGFFNEMPVRVHMYVTVPWLEVVGNFTKVPDPDRPAQNEPNAGQFNLTVIAPMSYGVLKIFQDQDQAYNRGVLAMSSGGHDDEFLDLGEYEPETDYFLKVTLLNAVRDQLFYNEVRLFFLHFGDKLIERLKAMDNEGDMSSV